MLKKLIAVCALTAVSVCQSLHAETDSNTTMLTNTCVACHGNEGNSNGPAIPNIAGLSPIYFIGAMLAYKYEDEDQLLEIIDGDVDFEDVEAFPRYSTIMGRIAKGYTEEEIKLMAEYFSAKEVVRPAQAFNVTMAAEGKKLHEKYCEKCHENEGRSADDDTGVLAGQWQPYFLYSMHDFSHGARAMPKKMKNTLDQISSTVGHTGIEQLAHYYASIQD
jgi:sulfide dehydrogenase cytochrome subunit